MYDYCMYKELDDFVMHVVCMSYSRYNGIQVPYIFFFMYVACCLHDLLPV